MKPPKFRYYLEPKNKDPKKRTAEELIMVSISYGYSQMQSNGKSRSLPCRVSVEAKIQPNKFGDIKTKYKFDPIIFKKHTRKNRTIENKMNRIENEVSKLEAKYVAENKIPSPKELKEELLIRLNRKDRVDDSAVRILEFLQADIEKYENGMGKNAGGKITANTIKTYKTLKTLIEEYESVMSNVLFFKEFNVDYYWKFWDVTDEILRGVREVTDSIRDKKQTKNENGYSVNSIRKYQDALIKTIRRAKESGFVCPLDVNQAHLKTPSVPSSKDIFVNQRELRKLIDTDVSYDNLLQMAKEFIIISSLTGMRYQSMVDSSSQPIEYCEDKEFDENGKVIKKYNFKYFLSTQQKTNTEVYVPIMKPVEDIINRHGGMFPKWSVNGTINRKLKKLFKLLEFDDECIEKNVTYHFGEIKTKKPKYKLITAHDGRKSFLTNLDILRVDPDIADNMTHPDKKPNNAMRKVYVKTESMLKTKRFVDEINRINSDIYTFG